MKKMKSILGSLPRELSYRAFEQVIRTFLHGNYIPQCQFGDAPKSHLFSCDYLIRSLLASLSTRLWQLALLMSMAYKISLVLS